MKLCCPHCALEGVVKDFSVGKKVRCPECKKVFRLTENFSDIDGITDENGRDEIIADGEVRECAGCGFSLSSQYLTVMDSKYYCAICLPS